jgi:hypothetical protein
MLKLFKCVWVEYDSMGLQLVGKYKITIRGV